jgi:hypothetical protein
MKSWQIQMNCLQMEQQLKHQNIDFAWPRKNDNDDDNIDYNDDLMINKDINDIEIIDGKSNIYTLEHNLVTTNEQSRKMQRITNE